MKARFPPFDLNVADDAARWAALTDGQRAEITAEANKVDKLARPCLWFNFDPVGCKHWDSAPGVCRDFAAEPENDSSACFVFRSEFEVE